MAKNNDWLIKKGATPTEMKLYEMAVRLYKAKGKPLQNNDMAAEYECNRTNIRMHMANMINKGIIKRHLHRYYIPVI